MKDMIAVSTNTYHGFSVDQALEGIAAAGFKYVELTAVRGWTEHIMPDMSEEEVARIKEKMEALGLTCIALSGHCNLMEQQRLNDFKRTMELAYDLGAEFIVSSAGEAHFGENEIVADDVLAENIKTLIPDIKRYGLKLVIEIHGEYGTGESLLGVINKVDSDIVGINYDTGNVVFYGGKQPEDDIKTCVNHVMYVHVKDKIGQGKEWNFPAIGYGDLKIEEFINYLKTCAYQGPLAIEIEFTESYTMKPKKEGDLATVNKAVIDSYNYLSSIDLLK